MLIQRAVWLTLTLSIACSLDWSGGEQGDADASTASDATTPTGTCSDAGMLPDGTSCVCSPKDSRPCAQSPTGFEIVYPMLDASGQPLGVCKLGMQTCSTAGQWGACQGAVAPTDEVCDEVDDDCDGELDDARTKIVYRYDADGDEHGATWASEVESCAPPATAPADCATHQTLCPDAGWTSRLIPVDDCDDAESSRHPGAQEICNRLDDDCDKGGGVEEAEDADEDGFTNKDYFGCSGGFPRTDCYDADPLVRPDQTERFTLGYCLAPNARIWCHTERMCAARETCTSSIGQEWGPGSVDFDCDSVEEPYIPTLAEEVELRQVCAAAQPPDCVSPDAPSYAVQGAPCGAIGSHQQCKFNSSTSRCSYQSVFLMTACN